MESNISNVKAHGKHFSNYFLKYLADWYYTVRGSQDYSL